MGFGDTKAAHDVLILAQPGETYEIEVKKNDKGYNDWISATKSNGAVASARPASASPSVTPSTAPRSNFETPEERAKKQVYIVRQSSISSAIALLAVGSKSKPDVKEVIDVASQLENYVFGNGDEKKEEAYVPAKPSDLDDDIPF